MNTELSPGLLLKIVEEMEHQNISKAKVPWFVEDFFRRHGITGLVVSDVVKLLDDFQKSLVCCVYVVTPFWGYRIGLTVIIFGEN